MGSDHDVYQDSSFKIPAIYLNDWPDRYIHTNFDSAANIDPTKLKRAAFIGAASAYFLATLTSSSPENVDVIVGSAISPHRLAPEARLRDLPEDERCNLFAQFGGEFGAIRKSLLMFLHAAAEQKRYSAFEVGCRNHMPSDQKLGGAVFMRAAQPKGPLAVFGYDYFADHAKAAGVATPKLLSYEGLWGAGEEYAYEVLNFVDAKRSAQQIRDAVSAEYGPVPLEMVVEYLRALEKIGVVEQAK